MNYQILFPLISPITSRKVAAVASFFKMIGLIVIFHRAPSLECTFAGRNDTKMDHFVLSMNIGM